MYVLSRITQTDSHVLLVVGYQHSIVFPDFSFKKVSKLPRCGVNVPAAPPSCDTLCKSPAVTSYKTSSLLADFTLGVY